MLTPELRALRMPKLSANAELWQALPQTDSKRDLGAGIPAAEL